MDKQYIVALTHDTKDVKPGDYLLIKSIQSTRTLDGGHTMLDVGKVEIDQDGHLFMTLSNGKMAVITSNPRSHLNTNRTLTELPAYAISRLNTDDLDIIRSFYHTLGTWGGNPIVLYVETADEHNIMACAVGSFTPYDTEDGVGSELKPISEDTEIEVSERGFIEVFDLKTQGTAYFTKPIPASFKSKTLFRTGNVESKDIKAGDILLSPSFNLYLVDGQPTITLQSNIKIGSALSLDETLDFLGATDARELSHKDSLTSLESFHREHECAFARTEPDRLLALYYIDPIGGPAVSILGKSGYYAFVVDELESYLTDDANQPGLWTMDNLRITTHRSYEGEYDSELDGDWRPATIKDIEELFGDASSLGPEMAEIMEIDERDNLVEEYIGLANIAAFEHKFETRHIKFAKQRFGLTAEYVWTARQIVNPDQISLFAEAIAATVKDPDLQTEVARRIEKLAKSDSNSFVTVEATPAEVDVLATQQNFSKSKPSFFMPSAALIHNANQLAKLIAEREEVLANVDDRPFDLKTIYPDALPKALDKISPISNDQEIVSNCAVFSEARRTGGTWFIKEVSEGKLELALLVDGEHKASLIRDLTGTYLTDRFGFQLTNNVRGIEAKKAYVHIDNLMLDADRAACEIDAREFVNRGTDKLARPVDDGHHSGETANLVGYSAYVCDGVLHRNDGPAFSLKRLDNDEIIREEYRFRGNLHRENGPASKTWNIETWFMHGLKHRDGAPAVIADKQIGYFQAGLPHREDGPAITKGPLELYYVDGLLHRADGAAYVDHSDGSYHHYVKGLLHNPDGPAAVNAEGVAAYALRGELLTEEELNASMKRTTVSAPAPML